MAEEVEEVVRDAAERRGFHLFVKDKGELWFDDVERLSLWVRPSEQATGQWIMTLSRVESVISIGTFEGEGWATADVDSLVAEVKAGLESGLGLTLCAQDLVRGTCRRTAEARRLYRLDFDGGVFEMPGQEKYDLARRHAVRVLATRGERLEQATGAEGAFEVRFYTGNRSFSRGEFAAVLRNAGTEGPLTLSVYEPGDMSADDLDGLVADLKGMLESRYGRRPCRADPVTGVCDAAHAALEESAQAWLRARRAGSAAAVEEFLASRPAGPFAAAAEKRLTRLGRMAEPPPAPPPAPAEAWRGRRAGETFADQLDDGSLGPEMTVLPAGVFRMGCGAEGGCRLEELPAHPVRVPRPFALSTREVTHAEYFRFARPAKRLHPSWSDRPATHLAWPEAAAYAAWLSKTTGATYRLPSEAEWEHAARAGTATAYHWGDDAGMRRALCARCNGRWPPFSWVETVGAYPANAWGLHDMHGNAAEWTADCWREDHLGAPSDGSARADGDCSRRVVRGGSYETHPGAIRSAARVGRPANERYLDVGFRVLRELRNAPARDGD